MDTRMSKGLMLIIALYLPTGCDLPIAPRLELEFTEDRALEGPYPLTVDAVG